ncbi:MAG TPA: ABC transporter substrate-binding protein, partial [Actinomycetes bacterium]|nr:ABC transporter substrate-binding protein [Actinomycetes bacterium]
KSKLGRDPRWRQAVSLAVDRDRLATNLAGSPATTLVPPGTPDGDGGAAPCPTCDLDPARARALLAKAKTADNPVSLAVPSGAEARSLAALLTKDLATAGIQLAPDPTPSGETPVTLVRGVAPYPRPDPFLTTPAAASPPAKRLLDQARATADDPARSALYQQTQARLLADLTATPLVTEHHAAVLTAGPQAFNLTPWNSLDLAAVSLPA